MSALVLSGVLTMTFSRQGKYDEKCRFYRLAWYGWLSIDAENERRRGF
ncbi:hypothetical protein XCR1_1680003 [Xenorhabdus cabanillasii JM26]|uniref:Uncharacterized protein n=1 Tax=Xenorhabdus cabanillasii JM26 TaxID=1427517 RepID=W1IVI4_9GAMM|nr:hypothetical protein XCR1_1680003 [Xenorhabdus cabanillasii JM26]